MYALIDSHFKNLGVGERSDLHGEFIPYGLSILDNALRDAGYQGHLLLAPWDYDDFVRRHAEVSSEIRLIGIGCSTWTRFDGAEKIAKCRELFPHALIVAGGPHFGNCAEDALTNITALDIVVRGEADEVIVLLMEHALSRRSLESIQGISYRNAAGEIVNQGKKLVVSNLPSIRFMERFFSKDIFDNNPLHPEMPIPSMNILAGRGCYFACIFCCVNRVKNRMYPVTEIVDVIESTSRNYGIKGVKFYDDALTLNEEYLRSLCEEIIVRKLEIYWFCDSRANIDLDLLPLMYKAGCRFIAVGLETGSRRIQKIIRKKISNDQIYAFTKKCHDVGIATYVFLMVGFPDETREDLDETIRISARLSRECKAIAGGMGATVILPGTELEKIARERGILARDFSWHKPYSNDANLSFDTSPSMPLYLEHLTVEEYQRAKRLLLANYASSMGAVKFMTSVVENLMRNDIGWRQKFELARCVLNAKLKSLFGKRGAPL